MSKKFVVIDEIMDMLEAAKSGVVPGSVDQQIVSSAQNVPTSVVQHSINSGSSGSAYMTFPIHPLKDNCCIDSTYINLECDFNFDLEVKFTDARGDGDILYVPFYFGLRDAAAFPNQLQILIENSPIYNTTYQRQEATVAYCSMPESAIRGNPQYASIEKMILNRNSPMKRIVIPHTCTASATQTIHVHIHYKITQDIDSLTPILSNLHFTTPHMGNLQIREYFQDVQRALFFCPDYNWINNNPIACNATQSLGGTPEVKTVGTGDVIASLTDALPQPTYNQYWSFYSLADYLGKPIPKATIPFYGCQVAAASASTVGAKGKLVVPDSVEFKQSNDSAKPDNNDFMTFNRGGIGEIVQKTFKIRREEYENLSNMFASQKAIIIPTQTWATSVFNNTVQGQSNWSSSMIGTCGGYNINFVSVWFQALGTASFCWEPLRNIQLLINGAPVNALPYQYVNEKCITDSCQAILDIDHEEINHDYVDSLTFLNQTGDNKYMAKSAYETYGTGDLGSAIRTCQLRNPNLFCLNFSTNLPDAFHSGACTLESVNNQANIRFNSDQSNVDGVFTTDRDKFPHFFNNKSLPTASALSGGDETAGFCAFCDACILLSYDATRGRAFDGSLSWAEPYE